MLATLFLATVTAGVDNRLHRYSNAATWQEAREHAKTKREHFATALEKWSQKERVAEEKAVRDEMIKAEIAKRQETIKQEHAALEALIVQEAEVRKSIMKDPNASHAEKEAAIADAKQETVEQIHRVEEMTMPHADEAIAEAAVVAEHVAAEIAAEPTVMHPSDTTMMTEPQMYHAHAQSAMPEMQTAEVSASVTPPQEPMFTSRESEMMGHQTPADELTATNTQNVTAADVS